MVRSFQLKYNSCLISTYLFKITTTYKCSVLPLSIQSFGGKVLKSGDVEKTERKEMFQKEKNWCRFHLPFSPAGTVTGCVGTVSEFTFPFSNVSFSVCCNCQLRPNRCIAGGKGYRLFDALNHNDKSHK